MIQRIYEKLTDELKHGFLEGEIKISINEITVLSDNKDIVGGSIQDWLQEWMSTNNFKFKPPMNTQAFPDFYIDDEMMEVKSFYHPRSPAFDVAQIDTFVRKIPQNPEHLDAKYLIFSYSLENKKLMIKDIWLKNIWQITGASGSKPLSIQVKQNKFHNIRPVNWRRRVDTFRSKIEFLSALNKLIQTSDQFSRETKKIWKNFMSQNVS